MKISDFSPAEVQALVRVVESAPLQNMAHAQAVSALLRKFVAWHETVQAQPVLQEVAAQGGLQ